MLPFSVVSIIGIVQAKGGAGRSTVATNLAVGLSASKPTLLLDCDLPQGTSSSWFAARKARQTTDPLPLSTAGTHFELVRRVQELAQDHRYLVIDAPPRVTEVTRAILMLAHLCLVPLGDSAPEIWAVRDLLGTVAEARQRKPDLDARLVWTRYRAQTREARDLSEAVQHELGLPELQTRLGFRVAYSEALGPGALGRGVVGRGRGR